MAKRKKTKGQTTIYKTLHRKLKIQQHEPRSNTDRPEAFMADCTEFRIMYLINFHHKPLYFKVEYLYFSVWKPCYRYNTMATILRGHFIIVEVNASLKGDYCIIFQCIETMLQI